MFREDYVKLMENASNIRNVCIMAHVDHGKTTIADSLLASNGFISHRQAGTLRYLDNRPDEQRRGITMKSSATALTYVYKDNKYLINLIDSPGHIDFSSEVISVARISDGCLIVIDVNEGIRSQTITTIEIAIKHRQQMILVLNKIDKLIINKRVNERELYIALAQIIEQANAIVVEYKKRDFYIQVAQEDEDEVNTAFEEEGVFDPTHGNVVFASAFDGWAFTLTDFANMQHEKFNMKPDELVKYLWEDYYYSKNQQRFVPGATAANREILAETTVLRNIISVYKAVYLERNVDVIERICQRIGHADLHRVPHRNSRQQVKIIMSAWLPLHVPVFRSIVQVVNSPNKISPEKVNHVLGDSVLEDDKLQDETSDLISECDAGKDVLAYVAKAFAICKKDLLKPQARGGTVPTVDIEERRNALRQLKETATPVPRKVENISLPVNQDVEDEFEYCAMVRVFSGTLKKGMTLNLIAPDVVPFGETSSGIVEIKQLLILLGKDYIATNEVKSGNLCGVVCLKTRLSRGATLYTGTHSAIMERQSATTEPIYRCAIEPVNISDMDELLKGIRLLIETDSCAQCVLLASGQYVLLTAGHVHLEKCIEDLGSYTSVEFKIQDPLVQYRESVMPGESKSFCSSPEDAQDYSLDVTVENMPSELSTILTTYYEILKSLESNQDQENLDSSNVLSDQVLAHSGPRHKSQYKTTVTDSIRRKINESLCKINPQLDNLNILAIGNSKTNSSLLLSKSNQLRSIWEHEEVNLDMENYFVGKCLVNAFHQILETGILAEEPLKDVIFIVDRCEPNTNLSTFDNDTARRLTLSFRKVFDSLLRECHMVLMEPICSADVAIESALIALGH